MSFITHYSLLLKILGDGCTSNWGTVLPVLPRFPPMNHSCVFIFQTAFQSTSAEKSKAGLRSLQTKSCTSSAQHSRSKWPIRICTAAVELQQQVTRSEER